MALGTSHLWFSTYLANIQKYLPHTRDRDDISLTQGMIYHIIEGDEGALVDALSVEYVLLYIT